ncbi:MAG: hypothetical protein LUD72_04015 [Bacteroidales bacterium]|nr:hypothetical protein [Bacteroidales bacterium]
MAKVTYKHNYKNTGLVMKSAELESYLANIARGIQSRVGSAYEVDTYQAGTRVIASVSTTDPDAVQDNLDNNTLLKALK